MKKILLTILVIGFFIFAQIKGLFFTPPDQYMGSVQKLMYVHVPAAWSCFIAFFIVFIASILYLFRKNIFWDHLAASAAEIGCVLNALTLALGAIWGRPTWGIWWTWDPRLTTTAILLLLYIGYLLFRASISAPIQRAKLAAPIGILIFLNVPIVYFSVKWWRTLHQVQSTPQTVAPEMVTALRLNAFAFLGFLILFLYFRTQLQHLRHQKWEGPLS